MTSPSERRTRVRWFMVFLAFLATAINYIDRATMSVSAPEIQKDLGLSPTDMGWIMGAFFWTYALFQLPSGWFVDRVGARVAYAVAMLWWSVFTAVTGVARGFAALFGFRLLLGAGEAPAYPCNAKVVSEWFPRRERGLATAFFDSGSRVGAALSLPVVTALIGLVGWRGAFVVAGAVGILLAGIWAWVYRSPREHKWVSAAELAYIESGQADAGAAGALSAPNAADPPRVRWVDLFRYRTVIGMMLGFFCLNFVIFFFITWFPTYLVKARGFSLLKLGYFGMIPGLVAVAGGYLGGWVTDTLVRRGMKLTWARKLPLVGGMALSSSIALAVIVPSAAWALVLLSVSYASLAFAGACVWCLPADIAPTKKHVASIGGIQNFASNLAGICISLFVGKMLERTGNFVVALVAAGGVALLGAFAYLVIVPEIAPLPARPGPAKRPA